jgi:hypothetical protein
MGLREVWCKSHTALSIPGLQGGYDYIIGTSEHGQKIRVSEFTIPKFKWVNAVHFRSFTTGVADISQHGEQVVVYGVFILCMYFAKFANLSNFNLATKRKRMLSEFMGSEIWINWSEHPRWTIGLWNKSLPWRIGRGLHMSQHFALVMSVLFIADW